MDKDSQALREPQVKRFNIGGVEGDFVESPPIKIKPEYQDKLDRKRAIERRVSANRPLEKIYNRYHRMKCYWFKSNVDFRLSEPEYRELWDTAPPVKCKETGKMVPAADYADRHGKVKAGIIDRKRKVIDRDNIALFYEGDIINRL